MCSHQKKTGQPHQLEIYWIAALSGIITGCCESQSYQNVHAACFITKADCCRYASQHISWILGFTWRGAHKCLKQAIPRHVYEIFDCDEDLYWNPYKSSCWQFYLVTFPRIQDILLPTVIGYHTKVFAKKTLKKRQTPLHFRVLLFICILSAKFINLLRDCLSPLSRWHL